MSGVIRRERNKIMKDVKKQSNSSLSGSSLHASEVKVAEDADNYCDLDPTKICDNCFKCLETDADYEIVEIDGIYSDGKRIY